MEETFLETLDNIKKTIKDMTDEEYKLHNFTPEPKDIREVKGKNIERDVNMEAGRVMSKMNEMIKKNERRKNVIPAKKTTQTVGVMDITSNSFNVVVDEKSYTDWKKIEVNDQLILLELFFQENSENPKNGIIYSNELKDILRDMVSNRKILLKKDIIYDKINNRIIDLPILKMVDNSYEIKTDGVKPNIKKQNMNNVNVIFKKKTLF